ncbi:MAG: C39 family peptidase [Woeseiaceae bacterium]|nr:C39 family peptidase [Woeseiaceae bacterium]
MNVCGRISAACLLTGVVGLAPSCFAADVGVNAGGTRFGVEVRSLADIRNDQVVRQRWDYSCGSAALSTVLSYHLGDPTPETAVVVSILRRADPIRVRSRGGFSLLDLKHYLARRGYDSAGFVDLGLDELENFDIPPIVPVSLKGYDHFVVFRGRYGDRVVLADPAFGNLTMSVTRFTELWQSRIAFVIRGEEPEITGNRLAVESLPFPNPSLAQRVIADGKFRRVSVQ